MSTACLTRPASPPYFNSTRLGPVAIDSRTTPAAQIIQYRVLWMEKHGDLEIRFSGRTSEDFATVLREHHYKTNNHGYHEVTFDCRFKPAVPTHWPRFWDEDAKESYETQA